MKITFCYHKALLLLFITGSFDGVAQVNRVTQVQNRSMVMNNKMILPSIVNTITLSNGKTLKINIVNDNSPVQKNNKLILTKVSMQKPNGNTAYDKISPVRNTVHALKKTETKGNTSVDANGMICVSGVTSLDINSTDMQPVGSREFIGRFKPGTVLDLTQDPSLMHSISSNRKPITLNCDATGESALVSNPSETELNKAIIGLLKGLPSKTSSMISAKSEEISSEEEFALKISGGAKCAYGSVSAAFDFKNNKSAYHFLFDFSEESTVISADNNNDVFFTDATMQNNPNYGFVKAATYGRRILVCVETKKYSSSDQEKIDATFNTVFASGSAGLDKSQKSMFSNCSVKVFAIGGNNQDASIISISANDPDNLKKMLQNYLTNYDNSMLLPIKVNMSDLNGVPKMTQLSGDVPYVKCFNPTEHFKLTVKTVKMNSGPRSTYRMWGSFWIKGYDNNGKEILDIHKRNPQLNVTDAHNFISIDNQSPYKFSADMNREFVMDTRDTNSKIVFTTALDDNGDIKDSEQRKEYTLYMKDLMDQLASSPNSNEAEISYDINGGGFSITVTFTIAK